MINKVNLSLLFPVLLCGARALINPTFGQTDLAVHVGASLEVMKRDADRMRDHGPTLFTCVKSGDGVEGVAELIQAAWTSATGGKKQ